MRASLATIDVRIPATGDRARAYAALAAAIVILAGELIGILHGLMRLFVR
jgi:hypothetical protein